jgi:hypothetical protein
MSHPLAPAASLSAPDTRLHGRWLLVARVGWVVVTVTVIALNLIALPDTYGKFFTGFTSQDLRDLHQIGLTPTAYGIIVTLENVPFQVVNLALGLLLFWRRSNDRMALFCAFALVTFTNAVQLYDFTHGDVMPILASHPILHMVALVLFAVGEASCAIFFYLFPSGQFAPRLNPLFSLGFLTIPIFIAIAILRSRLWDIDTIINKALVYGSLTALLGALYAGLIVGLTSLAGLLTKQTSDPVALVVSTLAIWVLFQPARRRIQSFIDRRFYRKKYDAVKTLAAFSATLRQEVDLNQLSTHLLDVVQQTMQPASASLWLRPPERRVEEPPQRMEPHR